MNRSEARISTQPTIQLLNGILELSCRGTSTDYTVDAIASLNGNSDDYAQKSNPLVFQSHLNQ